MVEGALDLLDNASSSEPDSPETARACAPPPWDREKMKSAFGVRVNHEHDGAARYRDIIGDIRVRNHAQDAAPVDRPGDHAGGVGAPGEATRPAEVAQGTSSAAPGVLGGRGATGSTGKPAPGSEEAGQAAAKQFLDAHADPESFMNAIRNGKIPSDVLNSQSGMLMLQQQMQDIQRMFTLMTQMMQAMHELQMAIVRNIRAA
jgi:hypothetical protein